MKFYVQNQVVGEKSEEQKTADSAKEYSQRAADKIGDWRDRAGAYGRYNGEGKWSEWIWFSGGQMRNVGDQLSDKSRTWTITTRDMFTPVIINIMITCYLFIFATFLFDAFALLLSRTIPPIFPVFIHFSDCKHSHINMPNIFLSKNFDEISYW